MSAGDAGPDQASAGSRSAELRQVTDAKTMRALAHPVRIALLEALSLRGPMTATEVGKLIGESPTTCSFHLRQLARYGFVEEAGGGKGRARPWRVSSLGLQLTSAHDDPETQLAASALVQMIRDRQLDRYRTWRETMASFPRQWQEAAGDGEFLIYLTAAELKQLGDELTELLLSRFRDRLRDPSVRPPGSQPVEVLVMSYPIGFPAGGPPAAGPPAAEPAADGQPAADPAAPR